MFIESITNLISLNAQELLSYFPPIGTFAVCRETWHNIASKIFPSQDSFRWEIIRNLDFNYGEFAIIRNPAWKKNLNKRMVNTPKLYFLDTGLAAYLTSWNTPQTLADGAMCGAFFETWCIVELLKSYINAGQQAAFYFYRDKDLKEIDLLIEQNGTLYPVEFKKSIALKKSDIASFSVLEKLKIPIGHGALVSLSPESMLLTEQCSAIPATLL